jgi:heme-degrading monooxygenase HmoA
MIYELRHYVVVPGKGEAILKRFKNHTFKIFDRLGFKVHDFWVEANGSGHLRYVLEWQSAKQMESEWIKFKSDEEWQSVKAESEKDGPIVEKINVIVLKRLARSA